jgi:hypothetical protein
MLRFTKCNLLLGAALLLAAPAASAQVTVGADLGIHSAYVWRGLTLSSKPVAQPDLWVSLPVGASGAVTVGGWGNIELGKYDGADEISEGGGEGGPDLTEFNWWAEYAHSFGQAELVLGAVGYIYPNDAGITDDANTIEVYGRLGLAHLLSPRISAYYDVDKIKGFYIEGSLGYDVPVSESFSISLGALAGLSAGQGVNEDDPDEFFNFAENGLTHIDLSASTEFAAGPLAITPAFHFQISSDEATKFNKPSKPDESVKVWFGVTLSWASGGDEEEAE